MVTAQWECGGNMKNLIVLTLPLLTGCATISAAGQIALREPQAIEANRSRENETPENSELSGYLFMALSIVTGGLL
jgi:hypothetical protein